jgi:hypothetical protein
MREYIMARFALSALIAAPALAWATPPDACGVLTMADINSIAGGAAEKVQPRKSGNPSECGFLDSRRAAVLVVSIREVQYAAENELQYERETLEKIYRSKVKWLPAIGDSAFWLAANKQLEFRKGKTIVSVTFSRPANQNEIDTAQIARLIESRL